MSTDAEDTLTIRTERISGYVKIGSLNVGDEFETESTGGKVAWVIRNGHAQAVGVVFDGHSTETSIAPSMLVKVRKIADVPQPVVLPPCSPMIRMLEQALFDDYSPTPEGEDPRAEEGCFEGPLLPISSDQCDPIIAHPPCEERRIESRVHRVASPVVLIEVAPADIDKSLQELKDMHDKLPERAKPFAAVDYESVERSVVAAMPTTPPTIRIIQLAEPEPTPKAAAENTELPVCNFDLTLNEQQIKLLHFSSATDLFCRGLYFSWTKDTFFAAAKKHFPNLKCGQDREACMRQIALYRATLRKAGKLG